ncbi:MAG: roadblock/LC7 domain-containing protein [Candidatus Bathyarchaeota archaeon]|jgi:predicted regulator of Ras-like GTPase activity (Roadblock/LC7/MglB family)
MADTNTETDEIEDELEELQEKLQEIKDQEGIIGYILKGTKSASIDLKDPTKTVDYAVLSSTTFDASTNMAEALQMGEPQKIIIESEETKVMTMKVNNHHLTIFMEKNVNHNNLYKKLK